MPGAPKEVNAVHRSFTPRVPSVVRVGPTLDPGADRIPIRY